MKFYTDKYRIHALESTKKHTLYSDTKEWDLPLCQSHQVLDSLKDYGTEIGDWNKHLLAIIREDHIIIYRRGLIYARWQAPAASKQIYLNFLQLVQETLIDFNPKVMAYFLVTLVLALFSSHHSVWATRFLPTIVWDHLNPL